MDEKIIDSRNIKNQNDKKCSYLSWIFDIYFKDTFKIVKKRKYLEKILKVIPRTERLTDIAYKFKSYMDNKGR